MKNRRRISTNHFSNFALRIESLVLHQNSEEEVRIPDLCPNNQISRISDGLNWTRISSLIECKYFKMGGGEACYACAMEISAPYSVIEKSNTRRWSFLLQVTTVLKEIDDHLIEKKSQAYLKIEVCRNSNSSLPWQGDFFRHFFFSQNQSHTIHPLLQLINLHHPPCYPFPTPKVSLLVDRQPSTDLRKPQ